MKKVINVILVIILVVFFISFGLLNTSRNVLNTTTHEVTSDGKVNGIGAKYEIKGDRKTVSYAEIYNIDKIDLNIVHQYLDEDLKKQGIPTDTVEYVFKEDNYEAMYYDYRAKAIGYLKGTNEKPELELDRISKMVERGLTKYNEDHKDSNLDVQKIKGEVNKVAKDIDTQIEKLKDNKAITSAFKVATSTPLYVASIIFGLLSVVILIVINKINGVKLSSIGVGISGLILVIGSYIVSIDLLNNIMGSIRTIGIIYLIIGVLLTVIATIISKKKPKIEEKEESKAE